MERIGIAGLANSGKTTLFNAITRVGASTGASPFSSKETNIGVASVPDTRLDALAEVEKSRKVVRAQIEFADIAGLVAGAHRGEGMGNAFLGRLREVDAILCVLRAFEAPEVPHPEGSVDPLRDLATLETELCLADLESVEKAVDRLRRSAKSGSADARRDLADGEALAKLLGEGMLISRAGGVRVPPEVFLITSKPLIYAVNIAEEQISEAASIEEEVRTAVTVAGAIPPDVIAVCAQIEAEAAELDSDERRQLLDAYGLGEGAVPRLIRSVYSSLHLLTFFTAGEQESRAWTAPVGAKAPQAAGRIHSDMERGFIRAEVVPWEVLVEGGSLNAAKDKGLVRVEGKEYTVAEGDVVLIRFNV